jgi:hypothetical protein
MASRKTGPRMALDPIALDPELAARAALAGLPVDEILRPGRP